jgi:hypothetical protein
MPALHVLYYVKQSRAVLSISMLYGVYRDENAVPLHRIRLVSTGVHTWPFRRSPRRNSIWPSAGARFSEPVIPYLTVPRGE